MITIRIHKGLGVVLLVLAVLALGTSWAVASGDDIVYHACANVSNNGAIHYVGVDEECGQNEIRLVWNQQGPAGLDGQDGAPGQDGQDGRHCWDLNGNGVANPRFEDRNGDGRVDVLDCQVADSVWQVDLAAETAARTSAVAELQARVAELDELLANVSREGDNIIISGANLQVVNGLGSTDSTNSLGNIIIGYNESRDWNGSENDRSGSHMLVVGSENNYSSYGGIISGRNNTTSGPFSSVTGGTLNAASGYFSSVSGGKVNIASGENSSVSGGDSNEASGGLASVSGGSHSVASGSYSSISGGFLNEANNDYSSVSGGSANIASGKSSSVSGGSNNIASGDVSSVSGGRFNEATGHFTSVSGGKERSATYLHHWAAGSLYEDN